MEDLSFFSPAPRPQDERKRQAALEGHGLLDTPSDPAFDAIVADAARDLQTDIAAISLVDGDRQWFLARVGLDVPETPRACSFCAHAMLQPSEILCVPDATLDLRFSGNPLVLPANGIRFYAGAPLVMHDGTVLGALCVIHRTSRARLKPSETARLQDLAARVVEEIEARQNAWLR